METKQYSSQYQNNRNGRFNGNLHRIVFWVVIGLAFATIFAVVFGIAVKFLWAVTLSPIFSIPEITYWQAVGIVILSRLIFGGFGHRGDKENMRHSPGKHFNKPGSWRVKLHDRFHGIRTEEEKESVEIDIPESHRKHYNEFWEKEGKQAFDEYLSKTDPE